MRHHREMIARGEWRIRGVGLGLIALLAPRAEASILCDYYRQSEPQLYKVVCANGSSSSTKPAGANSTFSDSFNLNSASLPTEPSSYGLETLLSMLRGGNHRVSPTFSVIKGFHKFGTGISTSGNNTFFGNDIVQRAFGHSNVDSFEPHEPAKGQLINLNLGTSVSLIEAKQGASPSLRMGISARYNKTTDTWGGGAGLLLSWSHLTLGAGYSRETVSNFIPRVTFTSLTASTRLSIFEFEYTRLDSAEGLVLNPVHILAVTASIRKFTLTAATRKLDYLLEGTVIQNHFGVQYLFSKALSFGLLYNYIPGATTLGTQFYL